LAILIYKHVQHEGKHANVDKLYFS